MVNTAQITSTRAKINKLKIELFPIQPICQLPASINYLPTSKQIALRFTSNDQISGNTAYFKELTNRTILMGRGHFELSTKTSQRFTLQQDVRKYSRNNKYL